MSFTTQATGIAFIQNNLELAKQKAANEGKLILVDFWAHWCSPCTWMDEHTFTNKDLSNYLNENYISVRIDIDNIEGYAYKEEYKIRYLPSILILNEQGQLIKKYEESFAPSKLLTILKEHNKGGHNRPYYATASTSQYQPDNAIREEAKPAPSFKPALSSDYTTTTPPITSYKPPTEQQEYENTPSTVTTNDYYVSSPAANSSTTMSTNNAYARPTSNNTSSTITTNQYTSRPTTYNNTELSVDTEVPTNSQFTTVSNNAIDYSANGTYEFSVKPAPTNGYSVQVGAYYEYGNVLREVAAFQKKYIDVVFVHISRLNGANCYKVLLGHYGTRTTAEQQKAFLKEQGLDCFVKDLAAM